MRPNDVTCRMEKGVYFPLPMKNEIFFIFFKGSIISEQLSAHWKVANTKKNKKICDFM